MIPESLLTRLVMKRPFVPFVVTLSSGNWYRITDSDQTFVGKEFLMIKLPNHADFLAIEHIESIAFEGDWLEAVFS